MAIPATARAAVSSEVALRRDAAPVDVADVTVAKAVAAAVREMPDVVDLSPGLHAAAATYGPGDRVPGVVVHHPNPDTTFIEVHVVIRAATVQGGALTEHTEAGTSANTPGPPVLADAADRVRRAVRRALHDLHAAPPKEINVLIDDIQLPA